MVRDTDFASRDRREQEKQETHARILDAARKLFNMRGVEATTMRAIAEHIRYSATAIYYHFRDKDALLLELCYQDFGALGRQIAEAGQLADPLERLRRIGLAYVDFGLNNPSQYQFMFMTLHKHVAPDDIPGRKGNPEEDAYEFLLQTVAAAIETGRLRPELAGKRTEVANMLWSAVHGVVSLYLTKSDDAWVEFGDPRELAETTVDVLLRGITSDAR